MGRAKILLLTACALLAGSVEILAQGTFYPGQAISVTSLPGGPQGLSNVLVPIPSAAVYVCTGIYSSSACTASLGTKASLYSCEALSGCPLSQPLAADLYGNFNFWAAAGAYYYSVTGTVNGQAVSANYQITLPTACSGTCTATVFNALIGFEINGAAALDHVLLGNGTNYVDSATIPASIVTGLPGTYYQTVQAQGSAEPQEPILNFSQPVFTLTDAPGSTRTNVAINPTGTDSEVVTASGAGTSTHYASWTSTGDLGDSGVVAVAPTRTNCLSASTCAGGGPYVAGTTYTNGKGYAVSEEVTMGSSQTGDSGCDFLLATTVGGVAGPSASITNDSWGYQSVTFTVPPGVSFSATVSQPHSGCDVSPALAIVTWTEVTE